MRFTALPQERPAASYLRISTDCFAAEPCYPAAPIRAPDAAMPRRIIIDTDPGQDDAVAILLALASPELEVLGIVTVAGNVPLAKTTTNAAKVLELAARTDVPLYEGCDRPIRRDMLVTAEHVHGPSGLDGPVLPDPKIRPRETHGVDFIIETLRGEPPRTITLCTLGPLTNIATALTRAPDIAERIADIVMMGGAYFEVGNMTPAAEFNIFVDPEAADVVMRSGIPITMHPLDVTHSVLSTQERLRRIAGLGNACGKAVSEMLSFSERFDVEKYGSEGGPLHDPCVIAYLLRPEIFRGRTINVSVEMEGTFTTGMTVADYWQITDRPRNVNFIRSVDDHAFYGLLTERLSRLP
jgi:purine nucleosidase